MCGPRSIILLGPGHDITDQDKNQIIASASEVTTMVLYKFDYLFVFVLILLVPSVV